jgi:ribose/xylose/arabinose/galactoside ABC-type transport system permease subunit
MAVVERRTTCGRCSIALGGWERVLTPGGIRRQESNPWKHVSSGWFTALRTMCCVHRARGP